MVTGILRLRWEPCLACHGPQEARPRDAIRDDRLAALKRPQSPKPIGWDNRMVQKVTFCATIPQSDLRRNAA